ncbi:MAG: hypothetical protein EPO26_17315 [Chloroflexota bacterium]|nr:MAG: hypothetical protein EPO26_17315 [Chloroflexota bacterium]
MAHVQSAVARDRDGTQRTGRRPILVAIAAATALAVAVACGAPVDGVLQAERTRHDFGTVKFGGGVVTTSFPLTVNGAVEIAELGST